jgi:hypothetical protein
VLLDGSGMKPRHAAALALVGWYLMMPPLYDRGRLDETAPLKQRTIIDSFDRASECTSRLSSITRDIEIERDPAPDETLKRRTLLAACVATDDPRLAK